MSWIREVEAADAEGELKEIYDQLIASRGKVSNIMKVHSLNPGAMQKHLELYMHLMFGRSGLSRADREAIAVVVSATNNCAYCVGHHADALARYEKDQQKINDIISGLRYRKEKDRTARMLNYAATLTENPAGVTEKDLEGLRECGFSDDDILDINLVTAYFNFVNRIALGLGVEFTETELTGYKV